MHKIEKRILRSEKETIHSGHFMVSHFEAEAQDDYDDLVTVPDEEQNTQKVSVVATYTVPTSKVPFPPNDKEDHKQHQQLSIEVSLTKLFRCMSLAYRQKLTSPKWNRFKGVKLRWKDKIRLNNVIWRCWHMQFIKKQNTLVCQFASPLDVDTHVKPETTILEGKYWKRRAEAVIAEYKKWRKFHIMRLLGKGDTSVQDTITDMDTVESQCSDLAGNMLTDEDYLNFMTDTLFSTITNHQPFAFPDCREIAKGAGIADFIQPSLGPLQPNLDDFMDTLEPLQEFAEFLSSSRLPPVPEESALPSDESLYRSGMTVESYNPQSFISEIQNPTVATMPTSQMAIHGSSNNTQIMQISDHGVKNEQLRLYNNRLFTSTDMQDNIVNTQEMLSFQNVGYEQQPVQQTDTQAQTNVYTGKASRMQYVNTPKVVTQVEPNYNKYSTAIPPSQTAPETVSLLQQPVQNHKYASTVVMQGRSGYTRDKQRSRVGQYSNQMAHSQYHAYGQSSGAPAPPPAARQPAPQPHYLQPTTDPYKGKIVSSPGNPRSFKMPSPPASVAPQQGSMQQGVASPSTSRASGKEQYRSHSLPLGTQLNPDWTMSAAPTPPTPEPPVSKHVARGRSSAEGAPRLRSRSSNGGGGGGGGGGAHAEGRAPPPLLSAASDPALPHASVMLAQLLSAQHSQSLYKLNSNEDVAGSSDPTKSPITRGQPSPIGSDVMSPHHSVSPPTSPGSPRRTHLHAEQKRRYNIKYGFDSLQALIPHLNLNPGAKISKAAMLQKGAEYIKQLKAERNQLKEEMESLRQQIECLHNSISNCHSLLPATGAPVSRARAGRLREMFARHVANRTMHNWKYWLFSVVSATLVESFSACVSSSSGPDLVRTTLLWAEQHCSLVELRPAVLNSLRILCTTTDILTNPERLPDEARAAVAASAAVKTEPT